MLLIIVAIIVFMDHPKTLLQILAARSNITQCSSVASYMKLTSKASKVLQRISKAANGAVADQVRDLGLCS